jgi:molecular chaperone DnaK
MTSNTKAKVLCGIDLGTHSCQVAYISNSGKALPVQFPDGNTSLRSVVYFQNGEDPIVGLEAENLLLIDPQNGVRHWKRAMGSDKVLFTTASGREYRAEDIAKLFLSECKKAFENEIGQICQAVVITVPANYNDLQKDQTIKAAESVGFSDVNLIHEPTAAMFSRLGNSERETPDGMRIVVDCGGGTLDISVCEKLGNRYEIKVTNGVPQLGGMDFTKALFDHCASEFRNAGGHDLQDDIETGADLWRRCEEGKIRLNRSEKITIPIISNGMKHQVSITKDEARELWKPLVDQILKCISKTLKEANIDIDDVCELIPIGGGSQLFVIQEELARFFNRPISNHADPIHAVATGAVLKGWEDLGEIAVDDATILPARGHMLRDITAHALGVKALDENGQERFTAILEKGVPLPSFFQKTFRLTGVDEATSNSFVSALVEIYQGEPDQEISECFQLGDFELSDLPNIVGRPHRIEIEMRIDKNGMLTATAICTESQKTAELQVAYKKGSQAA